MSKYRVRISDLLENQITGEWGNAPSSNNAIPVIRTTNFCDDGQINFGDIAYRDIPLDKANKKYIKPGDIIIEKSGGTDKKPVGRVVYCENCFEGKKVLCNNFTQILRVNSSVSNPRYVFYLMYFRYNIGIPEHFQNKTTGIRNLQIKAYLDDYVSITDYDEQSRVVSILDHLLALINTRKQQLSKFDELAKSRFIEMFGDFPLNEKKWETGQIRNVVYDVRYGTSLPASLDGKYPYFRMNNITYSGELDLSEIKRINIPDREFSKYAIQKGDVLFNRTNSKELVGKTCVYDKDDKMILAGFIIRIRVNDRMLPEFLSAFLNADFSKKMLLEKCKTAIGQANINAQELQNFDIYIPPIELQKQFVFIKNQLDKSKFRAKKCFKLFSYMRHLWKIEI